MSKSTSSKYTMPEELADELYGIVAVAGTLSREIRMCGNVIYHWTPTFKDGMYVQLVPHRLFTDMKYQRNSIPSVWNA